MPHPPDGARPGGRDAPQLARDRVGGLGTLQRRAFRRERVAQLTKDPAEIGHRRGGRGDARTLHGVAAQRLAERSVPALVVQLVRSHAQVRAQPKGRSPSPMAWRCPTSMSMIRRHSG